MLNRKPFKVKFHAYGAYREGVFTAHSTEEIVELICLKYGEKKHNVYIMEKEEISLREANVILVKKEMGGE
ncbi:hypothetical protein [Priestia megaterium]|uniref:hypothetical protein n=1 Tax=Priestia megaterium TaxID=1404 RepID=UPI00112CF3D3|nr:hypothetical protein [Priestia megaterium]TPF18026.1 hypothetical protein CBE78_02025 [Priestia megaterium]TPF22133.1 hypothetical protein CBE79_04530 [Priestia megaterium]